MRLKSFYGQTLSDAMSAVREALGDKAIIVATRDDDSGGIRVTAAIDETPTPSVQPQNANRDIQDADDNKGSALIEIIAKTLLEHRTTNALAERVLSTATQLANEDPVVALAAAFDTHLRFAPLPEDADTKPVVLIGPPGVGKTLTIAKLATKAVLTNQPVSVISTDTQRAGGLEQLAAFTRLLQLELTEIEDTHALREAILMQQPGSLILIDTPGCNPFDQEDKSILNDIILAAGGEAALVLQADMDSDEAIDMTRQFREIGATKLVFTRLDLAHRYGNLLRTSFETRTPLANFCASPKVTIAPCPFNPVSLARLLLPKDQKDDELQATGTDKI